MNGEAEENSTMRLKKKHPISLGTAVILVIIVAVIVGIIVVVIVTLTRSTDSTTSIFVSDSVLGRYTRAAVATNGPECAPIARDILARNGSAVDAAIATLLCEGVVNFPNQGLGGGFFMTIWDAETQTAQSLDARETAPALATQDMFAGNAKSSTQGGLAVAVPGELLGYWEAHQRYGRLPWAELFNAAIKLCEDGSLTRSSLASALAFWEELILAEPTMSEILINPDTGHVWTAGYKLKRPKLAVTLRTIAEHGADVFYNGPIGEQLVKELQAFGGILQMDDLRNYRALWKTPTKATFGNHTMYSSPPPGSGVVLTFIMNVLQGLIPANDENTLWQRIVETFKWAYARRTELGDPDFVDISGVVANLTSTTYADTIRDMIRDNWTSTDPLYYGAETAATREFGTGHTAILASDGSAVSVTSTINLSFGATIRSNSTGIIFNSQMDEFGSPNVINSYQVRASPTNYIAPGKRPLSSTTPTIVIDENKKVRLLIGGSGGPTITTGVAVAMVFNLWLGYDIKQAVDVRKLHHQFYPMTVQNENEFSQSVLQYLTGIGHTCKMSYMSSELNAIAVQNGSITANSDYRKGGVVAGY